MDNNLYYLDSFREHIIVKGKVITHVFDKRFFENIISGKISIREADDLDDFIPTIIKEWLENAERYK